MSKEIMSDKLLEWGVYLEQSVGNKWCFKYQFPGQSIIIVSNEEKEKAASLFFIEFLKSLHYSMRWLYENGRHEELKNLTSKMSSLKDPNIDKTIEIFNRMLPQPNHLTKDKQ